MVGISDSSTLFIAKIWRGSHIACHKHKPNQCCGVKYNVNTT